MQRGKSSLPKGMGLSPKERCMWIEATMVQRLMAVVMQRLAGSSMWSMSSDGDGGVSAECHIGQVRRALAWHLKSSSTSAMQKTSSGGRFAQAWHDNMGAKDFGEVGEFLNENEGLSLTQTNKGRKK